MAEVRRSVWFLMVHHPLRGPIRVGKAYSSPEDARGWRAFVSAAWRGCRVSVRKANLRWVDGELDEASKRLLDQTFNMDPPAASSEVRDG